MKKNNGKSNYNSIWQNMNNYFRKIPNEIFLLICSFLECKDCLILKQVCKKILNFLEEETPFKFHKLELIRNLGSEFKHPLFAISSDSDMKLAITSMLSEPGKYIAIDIYDPEMRNCKQLVAPKYCRVDSIYFFDNGKKMIILSNFDAKINASIYNSGIEIYDVINFKRLLLHGHINERNVGHLFADGERFAFLDIKNGNYFIKILDLESNKVLSEFKMNRILPTFITSSSDGKYLAVAADDLWGIRIWNLETKKFFMLESTKQYDPRIIDMIFFSNNKKIISGSQRMVLEIWDMELKKSTSTLMGHNRKITSILLFPGEKKVISGSLDKTLKIWDLIGEKCLHTISTTDGILSLTRFPKLERDYEKIIVGLRNKIQIWKIPVCPIHDK